MVTVTKVLTALMGIFLCLPFALRWVFMPVVASAEVGRSLSGPAAYRHMRGDTGGAFFAVGALLLLGLYRREPGYLEAVALIMAGIVAGRLLAVALDGFVGQIGIAMGFELVTAVAALVTARQMR